MTPREAVTTAPTSWLRVRELTGISAAGLPVDIETAVVETAEGPMAVLRVGECVVLVDDALGAGLMTGLLQASGIARSEREVRS